MKPVISVFGGHDSSISIYDPNSDRFFVIELERIDPEKHYFCYIHSYNRNKITILKALRHLKRQFGIENDFSMMIMKKTCQQTRWDSNVAENTIKAERYCYVNTHHHVAHGWCAYLQSPYKNAIAISWDGGGDHCSFMVNGFKDNKIVWSEPRKYNFGMAYNHIGTAVESISVKTDIIDVAGKLMGLTAYGKGTENTEDYMGHLDYVASYDVNDVTSPAMIDTQRHDRKMKYLEKNIPGFSTWYYLRHKNDETKVELMKGDAEKEIAYAVQKFMETRMLEIIEEQLLDKLENEYDNNLCLSGGCALNVLVNQAIRKRFPHLNVYVCPNPHDGGLSFGLIGDFLTRKGYVDFNKYNITYAGLRLLDDFQIPDLVKERGARETTTDEMVSMIREGKIIGFCQGTSEVGPRALGNRSILCNPEIQDMKDILNSKVKFREWYRPFAPICRLEDAPTYFESPTFENMETMSFVADVKEEYKDKLPSITHVDGTARLQTVTETSNPLMYEILTKFGGVMLNTSFNVQGQPILNRATDALMVLDNTGMDNVVLEHEGTLYLF